jgi:hypothetical protein
MIRGRSCAGQAHCAPPDNLPPRIPSDVVSSPLPTNLALDIVFDAIKS